MSVNARENEPSLERGAGFWLGCAFLALQIVWIFVQLPMDTRYFAWAMFHSSVEYQIAVELNGVPLGPAEIEHRYSVPAQGTENRALQHLKDKIVLHEARHGQADRVIVRIDYTDANEPGSWSWKSRGTAGNDSP